MTVASHVQKLREKHENLSKAVQEAQRAPGTNDFEISELKKEKLRIKQEIERLIA